MLVGPLRYDEAGEELLRVLCEEAGNGERAADVAEVAALFRLHEDELRHLAGRGDLRGLEEIARLWNDRVEWHARTKIVLIDHGDEVEIVLGKPAMA